MEIVTHPTTVQWRFGMVTDGLTTTTGEMATQIDTTPHHMVPLQK